MSSFVIVTWGDGVGRRGRDVGRRGWQRNEPGYANCTTPIEEGRETHYVYGRRVLRQREVGRRDAYGREGREATELNPKPALA